MYTSERPTAVGLRYLVGLGSLQPSLTHHALVNKGSFLLLHYVGFPVAYCRRAIVNNSLVVFSHFCDSASSQWSFTMQRVRCALQRRNSLC